MLVVSIPASDIEVGGEAGKAALERLSNVIFRQEASWKPASAEEGFEIVRRRLFEDVPAELARERDAVVGSFGDLYQKYAAEFPLDAREAGYGRRLQAAYPIHPELFDQLFENWSTLEKFQRTRGVLRLMAAVIHELWARDDAGLLIMPASTPIDAPAVQAELTRYLEDGWTPVIESDVDGPNALPRQLDLENPNLKRYSATRRVARTIYMGSAPTLNQTNRGIDDRSIKLGCVQPGESPAIFGDALRRLSTRAMYLVEDHGQYWYALGQTISRTAEDRKQSRFLEEHADEEIRRRMLEVPDEDETRLVVLGPDHPHASGTAVTAARGMVDAILAERAGGPRVNRNMLVFLAPDKARLEELRDAARSFLAWESVVGDHEELNLDAQQRRHAETQQRHFDETVTQRIGETFVWLLTPRQQASNPEVAWEQTRVTGQEPIPLRVSRKLTLEEGLITEYSGARLRIDLDRVPLWPNGHIGVKELWSYYAQYLYLPRLRDRTVLLRAIEQGVRSLSWEQDSFAYADGYDNAKGRYRTLVAGEHTNAMLDGLSVVVRPEAARAQLDEELPAVPSSPGPESTSTTEVDEAAAPPRDTSDGKPKRFYGSVELDPLRVGRDASQIGEAIVQHLSGLVDARVEVRLEIQAEIPNGAPEDVVRTVTENARTLRFDQHGFEQD
jgi:hypothetical protein